MIIMYYISMNILDYLINDVLINIMSFLNSPNKLKFLSSSKDLHALKNKVHFGDNVDIEKIHKLWYFNSFTNIAIDSTTYELPKSINRLVMNLSPMLRYPGYDLDKYL